MVDMKPWVFSVGPPGSLGAIDHQDRPIVHINDGFGKRKKRAAPIEAAVLSPTFVG
jgi:hypothetical protein